jgi:hypothetical protein
LAAVPWRLDRDDHSLATLLAARATESGDGASLRAQVGTMLMPPDDIDARQVFEWRGPGALNVGRFKTIRDAAADRWANDPPLITAHRRFNPERPLPPSARWRSAGRGIDLIALKAIFGDEAMPNGLALYAALGSPYARSRPESRDWSKSPLLTAGMSNATWVGESASVGSSIPVFR